MKKINGTCECCGGNSFKRINNYIIECEYCGTRFESKIKEAEYDKTGNAPVGHTFQLYSKYREELLKILSDGEYHTGAEIAKKMSDRFNLSAQKTAVLLHHAVKFCDINREFNSNKNIYICT